MDDFARMASIKAEWLAPLEAERDQLKQQVEKLLSAVRDHRGGEGFYCNKCGYFGTDEIQ